MARSVIDQQASRAARRAVADAVIDNQQRPSKILGARCASSGKPPPRGGPDAQSAAAPVRYETIRATVSPKAGLPASRFLVLALALIVYEYPFNESIRTMLRLEHLFDRLGQLIEREAPVDHHHALATIFEIMDVGSRADLKSDLLKELEKHRQQLVGYRGNPSISEATLEGVIAENRRRVRSPQPGRGQGRRRADQQRMADEHQKPHQHPRRHLRVRPAGLLRLAAARRDPTARRPCCNGSAR